MFLYIREASPFVYNSISLFVEESLLNEVNVELKWLFYLEGIEVFESRKMSLVAQGLPLLALFPFFLPQVEASGLAPLFFFFAVVFSDNGHILTTSFRLFNPHRSRREKIKFSLIMGLSILLAVLWLAFQVPYFWTFFFYFTAFHHMKQNLGMFRWMMKVEHVQSRNIGIFAYVSFALPFLFFHLRNDILPANIAYGILSASGVALPKRFGDVLALILIISASGFIFSEWRRYRRVQVGAYVFSVTCLNVFSMIYGRNFFEVYIPLLVTHGLTYQMAISDSLVKVQRWSLGKSLGAVVSVALFYGFIDWLMQAEEMFDYQTSVLSLGVLLGAGVTTGLSMAHYYIDGLIWKKGDIDYSAIYGEPLQTGVGIPKAVIAPLADP